MFVVVEKSKKATMFNGMLKDTIRSSAVPRPTAASEELQRSTVCVCVATLPPSVYLLPNARFLLPIAPLCSVNSLLDADCDCGCV